jgi:hypothetical protein
MISMAIRDIFKVSWRTFFDPIRWLDFETLKSQTQSLYSVLKTLFSAEQAAKEESFEEAMKRFHLEEHQIQPMIRRYHLYAGFFLLLGVITFIYAFYLLFGPHTIMGWLLGLSVCSLFLSQAFRFDFWAYQLKKRKLGATFDEWQRYRIGGNGGL